MATSTQFVEEVRNLAAENPAFVYRDEANDYCKYFNYVDGTGSCIVGQAAERLGFTVDDFPSGLNGMPIASVKMQHLFEDYTDDPEAEYWTNIRFLARVQHEQDVGKSWLAAVEITDSGLPSYATA